MINYQTIEAGDIIVSTPHMENGMIFDRSVILIISHDKYGTAGVIINKLINNLKGDDIVSSLHIAEMKEKIKEFNIPKDNNIQLPVCLGGPLEQDKGIILHSSEYNPAFAIKITHDISINASFQIIEDILFDKGPLHKTLILGYSFWSPGQLISEIKRNDWFILPKKKDEMQVSSAFQLLFLEEYIYRWDYALKLVGASVNNYSNLVGRA